MSISKDDLVRSLERYAPADRDAEDIRCIVRSAKDAPLHVSPGPTEELLEIYRRRHSRPNFRPERVLGSSTLLDRLRSHEGKMIDLVTVGFRWVACVYLAGAWSTRSRRCDRRADRLDQRLDTALAKNATKLAEVRTERQTGVASAERAATWSRPAAGRRPEGC